MAAKVTALAAVTLAVAVFTIAQAAEPKHGGILKIYHRETPPSLSIHEEATFTVNVPAMPLLNNLVVYDQHKPQNSTGTIAPELATSWEWSKDNLSLIFKLRQGVTWHDGKPFTAKDVKCTFDLLQGKAQDKFRKNPRKDLFSNISEVTTNGDFEVTLHLKRPQPSLLAMLA
ncbi:MAG: ABC transporter substrate-binding protein, partial [Pseudolabrys sp.]